MNPPPSVADAATTAAPTPKQPRFQAVRVVLRLLLMVAALGGGAWLTPTPFILNAPGQAEKLDDIVRVQGGRTDEPGHLYMTTVIYEKANLLFCLYAVMDPQAQLLPAEYNPARPARRRDPVPDGLDADSMMELSKYIASVEALRYLGHDIKIESSGVRVVGFLEGAPSREKLKLADVIRAVDGQRVRSAAALRAIVQKKKAGDVARLRVLREARTLEVAVPLIGVHGKALVGIVTQDAVERVKLPVAIDITTHNIHGASAGLMFALEIIEQLTPQGLLRGRKIAGTGTLSLSGVVGPIEGVKLKRVAAERVGASIFLVPKDNAGEAEGGAPPGIQVIAVGTLHEAVQALGGVEKPAIKAR